MPTLTPGLHSAAIPITVVPSGQPCGAQIMLSTDALGANIAVTSNVSSFNSAGVVQTVTVPVNVPSTGGTFYVWVGIYMNLVLIGIFSQAATITSPIVTVGPIVWS